ncbi:sentrin-specific protease 6 [Drosophila takahashii]|uniref:sentrin-specific protease 6 n=1 Tax=Drosophila takahashii TaxID=29030 RepID=UPI001CF8538A|nr:ubiquitin-like-specific protease 1C [Drosophila takahashii]
MERILKRRLPLSPLELQHKCEQLVDKAVRPISRNDYLILSRQLVINRLASGGGDWSFDRRSAKMLVVLECGQQHIITFTLPSSHCTVQDLLRQVDIQFDESTTIDAAEHAGGSIRVVVSVGFRMKVSAQEMVAHAEEMYREMQQAAADANPAKKRKREHNGSSAEAPRRGKKHKKRRSSGKEAQGAERNGKKLKKSSQPAAPNNPQVSEPKPKAQSSILATTTTTASWSAAGADRTPEERAERSRLRRNRRWILSRDCDDDDNDEPVVLLSSSEEDDEQQAEEQQQQSAADENVHLLMYPPTGTGGLSISMKDYMCLSSGSYLNDIIIDFYLRWLKDHVISEAQRERTHIFSSFFHKRLTTLTRPINLKQTAAQKRHERVKKWTRTVDIFDKDFIIVPFNEQAHWLLAIICFPSLQGPVAMGGDDGAIKQPVILIFDSLAVTSRHRAIAILRDYLTCEYRAKNPDGQAHVFNKDNMPGHRVEVPQQENLTDCGLYLLQYVEHFFTQPIRDYRLPIAELSNWFDLLTVTKKREDIANLIQRLMDEGNPQQQQRKVLPVIEFPTLNGQLVEEQEQEEDEEEERGHQGEEKRRKT